MENIFALAVQDMHSSCSETSERAFSRVRPVIPAALSASVQGTTVSFVGSATSTAMGIALGYVRPQTDDTDKALSLGSIAWSPPV